MRAAASFAILLAASFACPDTFVYDAIQSGKKTGTLTSIRNLRGGELVSAVKMSVRQKTQTVDMVVTTTYAADGTPKSKVAELAAGNKRAKITSTFADNAAKVIIVSQGKSQTRYFPATGSAGLADKSIWWFVKGKPGLNATTTYQSFNPVNMRWTETTAKYVGVGKVAFRGRQVTAHHVQEKREGSVVDVWLDDKGVALIIDQKAIKFVRR